jgi:hypothetical protein
MTALRWLPDDGGRMAVGFKGSTGDCVTRAVAIALELPYQQVYDQLNELAPQIEQRRRSGKKASSARNGVARPVYERFLREHGWSFTPTMRIGSGCTVHLAENELPTGRLIARVSKHLCAVIDGVIHDTHDPCRDGTRCVYGFYSPYIITEEP